MVVLLASKIQKPIHFQKWINRENMVSVRHEAVQSDILFINAPTGYGKTMFLTHWSDELDESVAWLTVDKTDNDALDFFRYIVYTVYSACKLLSKRELRQKLSRASRKELDVMWNFYKDVGTRLEKPVRLIIDNFHHINDPKLLEMIHYFVVDLPESLKICFASRHKSPFVGALWQSLYTVSEVQIQRLHFTLTDTKTYVKYPPHRQDLIWKKFIRMEGWLAENFNTLQSPDAQLQMMDRPRQFTGNVLTHDLWNNFSSSAHKFLLTTSILDTMNSKICNALLENRDSLVHLRNLAEKGFFIKSDIERELDYRYHPLFAIALRQNLYSMHTEEYVTKLHKKAAGVYFQQGDIVQAISHSLKGKAYPLASTWMMNYGEDILKSQQTASFISWCQLFEEAAIPLALDLQLLYAFALLADHQIDEAERVTTQMTAQGNREEWRAFTDRSRSAAYDYFLIKSYITIIRMGGVTEVGQWLQKGFDLHVEKSSKLYLLPLQFNKTEPLLSRTSLGSPKRFAVQDYQRAQLELESCQSNKLSIIGYYHGIQAETLYMKGSVNEAREQQVEALLLAHHFQDPGLLIPMYILSCKFHLANDEIEKAHETIRIALLYIEDHYWKDFLYALEAFVYLKQDRLEEAEVAFAKMQKDYVEDFQPHSFIVLLNARLLLKGGQWEDALKKVLRVKLEALEEGQIVTFIEATILESSCHASKEYWLEMTQSLQDAMAYSKEYSYTQLFVEEECMEVMLNEYVKVRKQQNDLEWTQVPYYYVEHLMQSVKGSTPTLDLLTSCEEEVFPLPMLSKTDNKTGKSRSYDSGERADLFNFYI